MPLKRVKPDRLKHYLRNHPDRELVDYLIDGYTNSFKLGWTQRLRPQGPSTNSCEVQRHPQEMQELVDKEIQLGHILGPFKTKPFNDMVYLPLNIMPK